MFERVPSFGPTARLWLDKPAGKGFGVQFTSADLFEVAYVRAYLRRHLPRDLNPFHQCDSGSYQFFEFWSNDQDAILTCCMEMADALGLDLDTQMPPVALLIGNDRGKSSRFPQEYDVYGAYEARFG